VDLLRTKTYSLDSEQEEAVRTALLAAILKSALAAPACQLQQIAQFVEITERDGGCTTPAEEFITSLVADYFREGLTPELVTERMEGSDGFCTTFADAVDLTRRFIAAYPEIIKITKNAPQPVSAGIKQQHFRRFCSSEEPPHSRRRGMHST